ncbi:MAG: hypothetical protein KME23_17635 [Goleter apudmare HA4340-LM2]|jgi:hypothetical protein|nr:hypothetical protein [Goleter apudmare HA4340-LM2]MBW4644783.1 hypothetical protein [Goleter apudmare HA4340-LM2]
MKPLDINTLVALCSFALALFTTATGAILWYVNSEKKKYASERDFNHLKRNQEQISQGIGQLMVEMDRRLDAIGHDILEIKAEFRHKEKP